ncbi:MHS family alpha-ketoglutarate permease-like MFS transporter [Streptomyces sp. 1114.5]|uniref:MFS transporter n=1 Tax=Streptomyces sp. 1114.5 TaxID=1938830 RepID=UPI000F24AC7B|nr:MFS transporter [Streptomyces sp. 1114.5]RKT20073.1 MHS family alpha-ketoglutarate permease-like MFS transporter [Streptomyces sp. 1114.5]
MTESSAVTPLRDSPETGGRRRELAAATVGSVVESFDWNIYAVLAPYFAADLFGHGKHGISGVLGAYVTFAVGFVARPVGSYLIGRLSDTRGRRFALSLGMAVIAAASLGIAAVPGQRAIGLWAAVLAVLARVVQGLAFGGEAPSVAAYVTETAPPRHRFAFSSVSYGGIILGSLLSFGVLTLLIHTIGKSGLENGGWRWGFVVAALLGLAAVWVRRWAPESAEFHRARARTAAAARPPFLRMLREHRWAVLTVFLNTLGGTVGYYFALVYLPQYAAAYHVIDKEQAASFMTVVLGVVLATMLLTGAAADRFGLLPVARLGFALPIPLVGLLLAGLRQGWLPFQVVAVLLGMLVATVLGTLNVFTGLLFPTEVRAVGLGVVNAATIAAFGGTFPLLAEWLSGRHWLGVIPGYVTLCTLGPALGLLTAVKVPSFAAAVREAQTGARRSPGTA